MKEKVRLYALARELNMESKDLLDLCRQHGIEIKNQLSSLDPETRDQVEQLVRKGGGVAVAAPPAPPPGFNPATGKVLDLPRKPPTLTSRPAPPGTKAPPAPEPPQPAPAPAAETPAAAPVPTATAPPPVPVGSSPVVAPDIVVQVPEAPAVPAPPSSAPVVPEARPLTAVAQTPPPPAPQPTAAPAAATPPPNDGAGRAPGPAATRLPNIPEGNKVRNLGGQPRPEGGPPRPPERRQRVPPRPPGFRVASPPPLKPRPVEAKKEAPPAGPKKIAELSKEVLSGEKAFNLHEALRPAAKGAPAVAPPVVEDDDADAKGKKRPAEVPGRDARHAKRTERQKQRKGREGEALTPKRLTGDEDDDRRRNIKNRLKYRQPKGPQPRKGKVPLAVPITVRSLSEAIGMKTGELLFKLMGHGLANVNINSTLEPEVAETVALERGVELDIKRQLDAEEQMLAARDKPDDPDDLVPRAPVVTIMGHVDHGKTSLLDRIRQQYGLQSDVVSTEAGGITQVIRAWRVEKDGKPITFLDTPGHEAFTKMRARGANVTDVAVIVVAVDDGVMPQTQEAIAHAKAAGVSLVVALNKTDLPGANVRRTEQQLYGLDVLPDNMGGDTPFVQTSAATGKGIDELLEQLSVVAELKELKANPKKPARGTCLEAKVSEGEGVLVTLLVQNGTLRRGDVIICGHTFGRVRALYDDLGRPIQEAGPSVPVRLTGLDEVPNADDPFQVVDDLATAREIAEKRKGKLLEAALVRRAPVSLQTLREAKVTELKVILKADFRGSIEAIKKELDKLQHEEVRVRVLHTGIGAITESDVQLALTSPEDTVIVGFNAVPDDRAKALAEERGIEVHEYDIIYKLTDDIRSALEGKLKPREEIVHLGRAVVRETFKISRVGTIAGCFVTQGVIERSAKVRVIRGGVVVYPPADRSASLESLKRFKEDAREVREGFECGLKVAGYDDIKVDDLIEAYRVEQVQRTLEK